MPLGETLRALADKNRRKVLEILKRGDLSVGEILLQLNITGASLSHHLNVLRQADLVSSRREGQQIIYSLNLSVFEEVINDLSNFLSK
ncbi:autorepressor SdpR family transcription factor [Patescibacteria group bacterium]|nr:autorepressor SdpR family transcription factor [Patescibacteria group bacterium]MBU1028740.1 autorepressor SdpR family transcription factor [Patescibacteria group bacterium]MBU1915505.1 autorepressor SdpR family transcription factor [Patescibacteria group bacterium]